MDLITTATSRRALLGAAGATGVVLAAGSTLAAATTGDTVTVGNYTFPALTTTPTTEDLVVMTFLDSVMAAAAEVYDKTDATAPELDAFRAHHRAQSEAFKALAGTEATRIANRAVSAEYRGQVTGPGSLAALAELTDRLIATLVDQMAVVEGTNASEVIAGAISSCARQRAVLGELAGQAASEYLPIFESLDNPFTMDAYPAERV